MNDPVFWLLLNLIFLIPNAFYSMMEMAVISLNKVRLYYWVAKGRKGALLLEWLLQHPFRLFGTTLIGVNLTTAAGSECSRRFHHAIGLPEDLAPLSQVIIVIIFGELVPMFAARHAPEGVALLGTRVLYASAKLMTPILWIIGWISKLVNFLIGKKKSSTQFFLSQEELEKVFEESDSESALQTHEINRVTSNIFRLRHKTAKNLLKPLDELPLLSSSATVDQARKLFAKTHANHLLVWHKNKYHIVAQLFPHDLMRADGQKKVRSLASPPWFVVEGTPASTLLNQFRKNREEGAVVINGRGEAIGFLTLDSLLEEIFGKKIELLPVKSSNMIIDRTFAGETLVVDVEKELDIEIGGEAGVTLGEFLGEALGHPPEEGESVQVGELELIAKACSLLKATEVTVRTRSR